MDLQTTGMEYALEMLVKASMKGLHVAEAPVILSPDGRDRRPHLRTWRDGWRSLRMLLVYCPRWLFLYPSIVLMAFGLIVGTCPAGGSPRDRRGPPGHPLDVLLRGGDHRGLPAVLVLDLRQAPGGGDGTCIPGILGLRCCWGAGAWRWGWRRARCSWSRGSR